MRSISALRRVVALAVIVGFVAAPSIGEAQAQTATQFYVAYRAAFDKAKKVEELFPYMSKATVAEINGTPAAERPGMFDMMKTMGTLTGLNVLSETKTADGATLTAEGMDPDKHKVTGTIAIVKEGGAWKVGSESWKN